MAQNPNSKIENFRSRVEWIVNNLDPDPAHSRFVPEVNDVFFALEEAVETEKFALGTRERIPGKRTWETALSSDSVPTIYLDWLYTLYPDLFATQLEAETLRQFLDCGRETQAHRDRWRPAIRCFAEQRSKLALVAKKFYSQVDHSHALAIGDLSFPLLTKPGWIRSEPLSVRENTEDSHLNEPGPGKEFKARKLAGLRGSYLAYKGALAYSARRVVKSEPQHNGEIFCPQAVIMDDKGFIGFQYFLSRYFDYINTCEVLGAELADWVLRNPDKESPPTLTYRGDPKDAFDLTNRAAYPGVNCLSVFLNYSEKRLPRGDYFLLHKRDETQLQAQNSVHVVPSGGHQGHAKGALREDTAIWRTMMREFAEELFNQESLYRQPETWQDFLEYKDVRKLKQVFFDEPNPAAKVYLHGFGLDPVTLKPEVLLTIIIDWDLVLRRMENPRLTFNWELQQKRKKSGTRHQWARLSKESLLREARGGVQTVGDTFLDTLPAGAACLMQTARHYSLLQLPHAF